MIYTDRLKREVIKVDDFEHDLSRVPKTEEAWQPPDKKKIVRASM
jgi:hypothetical protein